MLSMIPYPNISNIIDINNFWTTKIVYTITEASNVNLTVYDVLGREVEVLVDGFKSAGIYELNFNAENLPSGLYLYTFEAGSTRITRKMTLLK